VKRAPPHGGEGPPAWKRLRRLLALLVRAHLAGAVLLAALTLAAALLLTALLLLATLLALMLLTGLLTLLLIELDRLARFGFVSITAHVALFAILTHVHSPPMQLIAAED
jgi:hypothetical protein